MSSGISLTRRSEGNGDRATFTITHRPTDRAGKCDARDEFGKSDIATAYDRGSSIERLRHGSLQLVLPARIRCQLGRTLCRIDFNLRFL